LSALSSVTARDVILIAHRWLGLSASAVLAIVGGTGAILAWESWGAMHSLQRYAGSLHARLALGWPGSWLVITATAVGVVLQVSGVLLWWKRKTILIRRGSGWRLLCLDLHHAAGVIGFPIMLLLAVTGLIIIFALPGDPDLRRLVMRLHLGNFGIPVKALYTIATLGFFVQGATGLVVYWRPGR
jgi:uncharacterized iron-regulated membrane protein